MQSTIRYGQCWEDAGILLEALQIQPQHTCLAIASAGDNALAMLAGSPRRVIAIDYNPAQIACLELRIAAYRALDDEALLRFCGAHPAWDRHVLYRLCREQLSPRARAFWDARPRAIAAGYLAAGRFERYLETFRMHVLPHVHAPETIAAALATKPRDERARFYDEVWNTRRWRLCFGVFFSRRIMERLGRDPAFFRYAGRGVAKQLEQRVRHAFVDLDPSANPYLRWMLTGEFGSVLPFALRPENTPQIRANLDRLSWEVCSLEQFLSRKEYAIDRFALSDVFEYVDESTYERLLRAIADVSAPGARLAYWNMLVPRTCGSQFAGVLRPQTERATQLHERDEAFCYSRFVIEDVC
jgi:S-adenosylmethionine-diacylglycerol 3-amino-3-carboxypropyl transferase